MGTPAGFEAFFAEEYDGIVRALTLVFGDRVAAEDAAQVGFERALVRWRRVSAMAKPGTWVYVVAVRHGRHSLAREQRRFDSTTEVSSVDEGGLRSAEDRLDVVSMIGLLPPRQRAAVVLRHLADLSLEDVGEALGMRVGTVKSTLHAAHRRLRVEAVRSEETIDGP